ncbi:MerR family transcriptional regulator [Nocardia terpenica]|uniref:MerR family transcriptional regulator n=1 Tax=Nocardia terpenica TaxID=455432 RepID=A0A6G9Z281_9NOCA|nr:MerR family transcriptional regulator [Nocardia terpenica]
MGRIHPRDVDDLLSIGEFASRCGLSAKMLRSYAAAGLLVPAAVDGFSGYRYYSPGQVHRARVIALLRRAGIAVGDITTFFADPDPIRLDRWDRDIAGASAARRRALAQARAALAIDPATPSKGHAMPLTFLAATATRTGGRDTNQDTALAREGLFAVADGFGAHGDTASQLALDTLDSTFTPDHTISELFTAYHEANQHVWQLSRTNGSNQATGTTLTALALTTDAAATVLHVGDSRLYRLRHNRLVQLTEDHTATAELIQRGELAETDAQTHPHRHILTRALGVAPHVDIAYTGVSCKSGDRLLLCTDGVFTTLSPRK